MRLGLPGASRINQTVQSDGTRNQNIFGKIYTSFYAINGVDVLRSTTRSGPVRWVIEHSSKIIRLLWNMKVRGHIDVIFSFGVEEGQMILGVPV